MLLKIIVKLVTFIALAIAMNINSEINEAHRAAIMSSVGKQNSFGGQPQPSHSITLKTAVASEKIIPSLVAKPGHTDTFSRVPSAERIAAAVEKNLARREEKSRRLAKRTPCLVPCMGYC